MSERVRPLEYDRVIDDEGNSGIVTKCRRADGSGTFLSVRIIAGPRYRVGTTTWGKLWNFRPLLDYEGGTIRTICLDCERPFLATIERLMDRDYPKQDFCATHARRARPPAAREQERLEHAAGAEAQRTRHHAPPTRGATPEERTDEGAPMFVYQVSADGSRRFYAGVHWLDRAQRIAATVDLHLVVTDRQGRVLLESSPPRSVQHDA
jgi:hypothetical protein